MNGSWRSFLLLVVLTGAGAWGGEFTYDTKPAARPRVRPLEDRAAQEEAF